MGETVKYQLEDGVALLRLDNGKANVFSHELIDDFNAALDQAETDQAVVLITGREGMLSGGYDLKVMQQGPEAATELVRRGSTLDRRLLSFGAPIVIACGGHAVAKGAFLLLAADLRLAADGEFKIGLNEVAIGMTMHHVGIEMARERLVNSYYQRAVLCSEMFSPKQASQAGFIDEVLPSDKLLPHAKALCTQLARLDRRAFAATKVKSRKQWLATLDEAIRLDAGAVASFG